ncbi:MAG: hypothetical protein J7647_00455 [Cyanobacteria bacterium SBLK]|nr:hypothetical protein [Cyanobacteria bacterium SBLK]
MKISASTSTQLVIEPKASDLKATLIFFAIIIFGIFSVSFYLIGFAMPKDSTLTCNRLDHSTLQCQIKESFTIARTPKIEKFTGLTRSRLDKSRVSYFSDAYIQLQTQTKILGFVPFPHREISFPLSNYFDLIFLSNQTKNAIIWQIERFIGDRDRENLQIALHSYTILLLFCIIYFPSLLLIFAILIFAILTREKYIFDRNTQKMTWFNQILPFQPIEYQFDFSALKLEIALESLEKQDYSITVQSDRPTALHCLYSGRDRERASELATLLQDFLQLKHS